jgi:hypothetical protein
MKRYCFLLVIVILCLLYDNNLYDNNLYEGLDEYDTRQDQVGYNTPTGDDESGNMYDFLGKIDIYDYAPIPKPAEGCDKMADVCKVVDAKADWPYGILPPTPDTSGKKNCMDCIKCKNRGAFTDEFNGYMCDAYAGCYDSSDYDNQSIPTLAMVYAYNNTYSVSDSTACTDTPVTDPPTANAKVPLTPLQTVTCNTLTGSSTVDTLLLLHKPESAACHAEIYTKSSAVGQFFEGL